jgi:hypothetical protein
MEVLIFGLVATRNGYTQDETFVPEPAKFEPFDFRALRHSYNAKDDSPRRRSGGNKSFVIQVPESVLKKD